ncbi:hypothetical protein [Hymenobacter sp. GOD-10R]|uniref:hypothetical protein n=1 Tax=Hymenobacter sp. GOD-10R TaxID=3093922 RepID=UPI002D78A531|nr:hypothetical protein [Hymenobacter sp. GOD-10R]WRQ27881.1 hypothetical protein SD425_22675 [Hymenobacter sp. GOD-10R]
MHASAAGQTVPTAAADSSSHVLFKGSTGLTRGFAVGEPTGLTLPLVVGVECQVAPHWTVYANGFSGVRLKVNLQNQGSITKYMNLYNAGADFGVRRYYNQTKRRQRGLATGAFVGNYLALQSTSSWWNPRTIGRRLRYDFTAVAVLWGLQRRFGNHGLVEAYAGLGLSNDIQAHYTDTGYELQRRLTRVKPEAGIKLGFVL